MDEKIILAIVGLPGAGKTEAVEYLMQKMNWPKVYFGQGIFDELERRGLPINETNEKLVREDLRKEHGMSAMAVINIPKVKEFYKSSSVLVESLYSWEEYLKMKEEFGTAFKVLSLFSSSEKRIERLSKRAHRPLSSQEVVARDYAQIENLHQAGPIARADYMIINEDGKEDLYRQLDSFISNLRK